jgi:hypothetical protein
MLDEARRRKDLHGPRVDLLLRRDALDPTEVVDVGVRVDHRGHGALAPLAAVQGERGRCRLGRDERVDHDDTALPLDERDVRQVEASDLVDPRHDLEEPCLRDEPALPPQAGVDRARSRPVEEPVPVGVPDDPPGVVEHLRSGGLGHQTSGCCLDVTGVVERQDLLGGAEGRRDALGNRIGHGGSFGRGRAARRRATSPTLGPGREGRAGWCQASAVRE